VKILHKSRRARGFTLVEVSVAAVILILLVSNVMMVMRSTSSAFASTAFKTVLDEQADQTLDRITLAVMSSRSDDVIPTMTAPSSASSIEYQTGLGVENGVAVAGDPEKIELVPDSGEVRWTVTPVGGNTRTAVWARSVKTFYSKEEANGIDDDGNGLVDEPGLAFAKDGSRVSIFLSLLRSDANGTPYQAVKKAVVSCRN